MTNHIIRFFFVGFYLTYSYAGVRVFDIEIGKTQVFELWKKKYTFIIADPHPQLQGYYHHYYKLPKKVNGGDEIMVTAKGAGIIKMIYTQVDRKKIKAVFDKISKQYSLMHKMDTGPFGTYFFEKGDTFVCISDLPHLPYLTVIYSDTDFAKLEGRLKVDRMPK